MQEHRSILRAVLLAAIFVLSANRAFSLHSIPSQDGENEDETSSNDSSGSGSAEKIPFVGPLHSFQYQDPFSKGFEITTRVYTDPVDKLAHFDEIDPENPTTTIPIVLPYWECGVSGSTTVPVPLSSLTVRHLLGGSKPGSFEGGCGRGDTIATGVGMGRGMGHSGHDDTHPRLIIPLTPLEIVLNSGQTRTFHPGDVVLLENCLTGGHILQGHEGQDMIAMLLTLPHAYHHAGRDRNSLSSIFENSFWKQNPCKTGLVHNDDDQNRSRNQRVLSKIAPWSRSSRIRRRLGLGIIGAGISLALADFLGKVAPLALAVAAGGGLVAAGGTYGIVRLGEYGLDELDFWHERRLLRLQDTIANTNQEEEAEADIVPDLPHAP